MALGQAKKSKVFERDNWICQLCFRTTSKDGPPNRRPTIDHKIPRAIGGTDSIDNCQTACRGCNRQKACFLGRRTFL